MLRKELFISQLVPPIHGLSLIIYMNAIKGGNSNALGVEVIAIMIASFIVTNVDYIINY